MVRGDPCALLYNPRRNLYCETSVKATDVLRMHIWIERRGDHSRKTNMCQETMTLE